MTAIVAALPAPCSPDLILPPGFDRLGETIRVDQDVQGLGKARAGSLEGTCGTQPGDDPCEASEGDAQPGEFGLPGAVASDEDDDLIDEPLPTLVKLRSLITTDRGATIPNYRVLSRAERRSGQLTVYPDVERPRSRGECQDAARPCPWVSCRHHLYLDVDEGGALKVNFPHLEPWELKETCSLDVADRGGETLELVGELINVTRERTRQVEVAALRRARVRNLPLLKEL